MTPDCSALLDEIERHADAFEIGLLSNSVAKLCEEVRGGCDTIEADRLLATLKRLRNARAFSAIDVLCSCLLKHGYVHPFIRRFYAQSMIDRDRITAAIDCLTELLRQVPPGHPEHAEAHGLLGRCYKQLYVDIVGAAREERRQKAIADAAPHFNSALANYVSVVDLTDVAKTDWHSINVVALMARGQADGLRSYASELRAWAERIVAGISETAARGDNPWAMATVGEACVGLGNWDDARKWLVRYAHHDKVDAFMLYGTIRQLEEVWGIKAGHPQADQLMTLMKHRLATISRGKVAFSRSERDSIAALEGLSDRELEARLGKEGPIKVRELRQAFAAARSIAIVRYKGLETMRGIGTGFLVRGDMLAPRLGSEVFLLTNEHVISNRQDPSAVSPRLATVTFDEAPDLAPIECKEIVWSSPSSELDASLVRLDPAMASKLTPIALERLDYFPESFGALVQPLRRAYIIGHPQGGDLSISLDNAEIVDLGRRNSDGQALFVHYKTPTEPGSSGSPVFNNDWKVVALHHAGPPREHDGPSRGLRRLSNPDEYHWANEGVTLASIAARVAQEMK